ncbi:DUF746 domain-containing protein [Labrys portucalensis]|uniref:DUF746 domain-containing protein n=1 Tax=Labrys neptuniae TaxID=376174 RepID=A0ABV6ZRU0_9HYPH
MLPSFVRKGKGPSVDLMVTNEDKELSAFLTVAIEEAFSLNPEPPACPHCRSGRTILCHKGTVSNGIPCFTCRDCKRSYSRRTGTPLQGFRERHKLLDVVAMLSQQMPVIEAARRLEVSRHMLSRWVPAFRQWLLKLDPSGHMEAKVKLGLRPSIRQLPCPHCGRRGHLRPWGYSPRQSGQDDWIQRRQFTCDACGRSSSTMGHEEIAAKVS